MERQEGKREKVRTKAKEARKDKAAVKAKDSGRMQVVGTLAGGARNGDRPMEVGVKLIAA